MDFELNAVIVNSSNPTFKIYEEDLTDFGYNITHCDAKASEIIANAILTECEIILLSQNDFETEDELIAVIDYFNENLDKHVPLILNAPQSFTLSMDKIIKKTSFIHNIYPTGERRSIIFDIDRKYDFRAMSPEKQFFMLWQKVMYDCRFIGLNKHQEGYKWIFEAALLILVDESYRKNFSAGVYKVLGKKYGATYTQIETAIRRAMNDLNKRMDPVVKVYYFDLDVNSTEKYTATNFIIKIANNVRIQYKINYDAFMENVEFDRRKVIKEHFKME